MARQIQEKKEPDEIGEEGILTKIELPIPTKTKTNDDTETYFAKQWYDNQERQTPDKAHPEKGGELMSPYFHKIKYYESQLIHKALPEQTIRIEAAYDPRIDTQGQFSATKKDFPVTITKEVNAPPKQKKKETKSLKHSMTT
ncbi:MAG: hypothetical protein COU30_03110 [Candidatus Magasanikbacteria bacterium CG10_big_fil_rev_8_21_14_0_10_38_6]|uniref:Uncharacterized protein n=1 Tax=Candidatus Magasanikbacteria bacterium CG10_big_fil_rev_8_21_14_0_10_38_6 TaxID=1974647 RepID=A0A2M6P0R3_9BACT|nr:MAG: hypothetical protein COU30_03110 [Candidatus Magasanikbacteria bacterium CG10_big_fil_rev_8_21_14_0_10_38_6]